MKLALLFYFLYCISAAAKTEASQECSNTPKILPDGSIATTDCKTHVTQKTVLYAEDCAESTAGTLTRGDPGDQDYQQYRRAKYESEVNSLTYKANVFRWQYTSSKIIFWVVIALVLSGLGFSAIQFRTAMHAQMLHAQILSRSKTKAMAAAPDHTEDSEAKPSNSVQTETASPMEVTTIEASLKGIKITSSVLGLLILTISMGFFYLYLTFVYPIRVIHGL